MHKNYHVFFIKLYLKVPILKATITIGKKNRGISMKIKMVISFILLSVVITAGALFYNNNKNLKVSNEIISEKKEANDKESRQTETDNIKQEIKGDEGKENRDVAKSEKSQKEVNENQELKKDTKEVKRSKSVNDGKIKTKSPKPEQIKKEEIKYVSEEKIEIINFNTYRKENGEIKKGSEKVVQKGEQGSKKIIFNYQVVNGKKNLKDKNEVVVKKPIDQIIEVGTLEIKESSGYYDRNQAVQTLEIVNAYRKTHGKKALVWNNSLEAGTNIRAKELKSNFSHTRPNGQSWKSVSSIAMAENVAYGYSSPQRVIDGFMNSDGHRKNILNDRWSSVAMSLYIEDGVYYWAQLFAEY